MLRERAPTGHEGKRALLGVAWDVRVAGSSAKALRSLPVLPQYHIGGDLPPFAFLLPLCADLVHDKCCTLQVCKRCSYFKAFQKGERESAPSLFELALLHWFPSPSSPANAQACWDTEIPGYYDFPVSLSEKHTYPRVLLCRCNEAPGHLLVDVNRRRPLVQGIHWSMVWLQTCIAVLSLLF